MCPFVSENAISHITREARNHQRIVSEISLPEFPMRVGSVRGPQSNSNAVESEEPVTTRPAAQPRSSADAWHDALTTRNQKLMDNADKSPFSQARRRVAATYKEKGLPGPIAQFVASAKLGLQLGFNANKKLGAVPVNTANVPFSAEETAKRQATEKAEKLSRDIRLAKANLSKFEDDEETPISRRTGVAGARDSLYVNHSHLAGQPRHEPIAEKPSDEIASIQQKLRDFQHQTVKARPSPSFRNLRDSVSLAHPRNPGPTDAARVESGDSGSDRG
jgi:hypothetical protein